MGVLDGLKPEGVYRFFEEISEIPRGSGNEKGISDYLVGFAQKRGLRVYQDNALNVIIYKPGTDGYESSPPVIVQGHMDMVCEKNADTVHDFETDPLKLLVDGDYVKALGTTLGADNGVAVAYALALLDSADIPHPPLEVVMTVAEEVGLEGAARIEADKLSAMRMINMDCGGEGTFTTSCAGGLRASIHFNIERADVPKGYAFVRAMVKGLVGGHSGGDIHRERANANVLLGRLLYALNEKFDICLVEIEGGAKDNAIPREAYAVLAVSGADLAAFESEAAAYEAVFRNEFRNTDPEMELVSERLTDRPLSDRVLDKKLFRNVVAAIILTPNGVQAMDTNIEGMVETSNNLGSIRMTGTEIVLTNAIRSSSVSRKKMIEARIHALAECLGAKAISGSDYPAWEYSKDSALRKTFVDTYTEMYGSEPVVTGIHAGLECGVFSGKMPGLDMIAFGPDTPGVHTPDERMSISSVARVWEFLLEIMKRLK